MKLFDVILVGLMCFCAGVVVGPQLPINPDVPSPVNPALEGLALRVWKQATAVGLRRADAHRFGGNFESVASAIAAGGIKTKEDANKRLTELNTGAPRASEPLWTMLAAELKSAGNDKKKIEQALTDIAKGLMGI